MTLLITLCKLHNVEQVMIQLQIIWKKLILDWQWPSLELLYTTKSKSWQNIDFYANLHTQAK